MFKILYYFTFIDFIIKNTYFVISDIKIIKSPGLALNHYKPDKPVRINAKKPKTNEGWLGFGQIQKELVKPSLSLSKKGCLKEAAKNLYKMLRLLDRKKIIGIAVQKIPKKGIGIAINDRLHKASKKINER